MLKGGLKSVRLSLEVCKDLQSSDHGVYWIRDLSLHLWSHGLFEYCIIWIVALGNLSERGVRYQAPSPRLVQITCASFKHATNVQWPSFTDPWLCWTRMEDKLWWSFLASIVVWGGWEKGDSECFRMVLCRQRAWVSRQGAGGGAWFWQLCQI